MKDVADTYPYPGQSHIHFHFQLAKWDHTAQSFQEWVKGAGDYMRGYVEGWYSQQECEGNLIMQAEQFIKGSDRSRSQIGE